MILLLPCEQHCQLVCLPACLPPCAMRLGWMLKVSPVCLTPVHLAGRPAASCDGAHAAWQFGCRSEPRGAAGRAALACTVGDGGCCLLARLVCSVANHPSRFHLNVADGGWAVGSVPAFA